MPEPKTHRDVIHDLDGKAALARALGLDPRSISKWHVRGIPARYWPQVADLAQGRGIGITAHDLSRMAARAATADAI